MRKNFPEEVRKLFLRHICPKYVNSFCDLQPCRLQLDSVTTPSDKSSVACLSIIWKPSRLSENFSDCLETFQTVQKLSRLSENFPDSPETFQAVWKFFYLLQASFYDQFCTYAQFVHTHSLGQTNPYG